MMKSATSTTSGESGGALLTLVISRSFRSSSRSGGRCIRVASKTSIIDPSGPRVKLSSGQKLPSSRNRATTWMSRSHRADDAARSGGTGARTERSAGEPVLAREDDGLRA
jgi:hypothetical protein